MSVNDDHYANPKARWLTLLSICIATFLAPMSMSAVNVALPVIARDLSANAVMVSWIPTINILGAIAFQLPAGRMGDLYGRKKLFLAGVLLFGLAGILAALASNIVFLLAVRLLQGVAGAMIFGTGMAIISEVFARYNRGMALGFTSTSVYLGITCGPLIGGELTDFSGWEAVFLMPVPLVVFCAWAVLRYVKETDLSQDRQMDWTGSLLFILAAGLFFIGLSEILQWVGVVILGAGIGCLLLFIRQQKRSASPLVQWQALGRNRRFYRSIQASFCMYAANYPLLFLLSLYLQYIQKLTPAQSGRLMLIQAAVMACLSPLAGRLSDRVDARIPATIGALIVCCGFASLVFLQTETGLVQVAVALAIIGLGFGCFSSPNNNAALGAVPQPLLGVGSSLLNVSRTLGNMLGITVVVLLVNTIVGKTQLTPAQYPQLLTVLKIAFVICCCYNLLAAYFSFTRGQRNVSQSANS